MNFDFLSRGARGTAGNGAAEEETNIDESLRSPLGEVIDLLMRELPVPPGLREMSRGRKAASVERAQSASRGNAGEQRVQFSL